jgi:ATP-dependent Clp protease ATP-binding subunit ClpC
MKEETEVKTPVVMPADTELDDWRDALPLADDARHALRLAEDAAWNEGDDHLGTEHLLLGLRNAVPSVAAYILKSLAVEGQKIYERLEQADDAGRRPGPNHLPMTPAVKRILQSAVAEASALKKTQITTEHILLAVLEEPDSEAVHLLRSLDVDLEVVRKMILGPSGQGQFKAGEPPVAHSTGFRRGEPQAQ